MRRPVKPVKRVVKPTRNSPVTIQNCTINTGFATADPSVLMLAEGLLNLSRILHERSSNNIGIMIGNPDSE